LIFIALWIGHLLPLSADRIPHFMGSAKNTRALVLLVYCFIASITPVWVLLQPRDYLSSFLLCACLVGGAAGIVMAGITGNISLQYPAFVAFRDEHLGYLFPALFITVACGAVSGFHSIVASGTSSKQLSSEGSARTIAYGSMLVEGVLAVIALAAVMILAQRPTGKTPIAIFAQGVGTFFAALGISRDVATVFGLLAVSTFLLTTLDTTTRIARFIFQEMFQWWSHAGRIVGTLASLAIPAVMVFKKIPGPTGQLVPAWKAIWPAFGTTNQLLAALALLVVFTWLRQQGKRALYILIPMLFMGVTTLTSLAQLTLRNLAGTGSVFVGGLSAALLVMAVLVIVDSFWNLSKGVVTGAAVEEEPLPDVEK
jgi:carbon starvation protein